jgi:hypothetical protein
MDCTERQIEALRASNVIGARRAKRHYFTSFPCNPCLCPYLPLCRGARWGTWALMVNKQARIFTTETRRRNLWAFVRGILLLACPFTYRARHTNGPSLSLCLRGEILACLFTIGTPRRSVARTSGEASNLLAAA